MLVILAKTLNTTTDYLLGNTNDPTSLSEYEKDETYFQAFANKPFSAKMVQEVAEIEGRGF